MSQSITRVAGVLDVMLVLSGSWILYITKVEGPMSGHGWVQADRSSAEVQRRFCRGVCGDVGVFSPVRVLLSEGRDV